MILKALYDLAKREDLIPDPDFEIKPISWIIRVGDAGKLLGIESIKQSEQLPPESKKKPKMFGVPMFVPYQGGRTGNDKAFFLVDKSEYVLGLHPKGERDSKKLKTRLTLFRNDVEACWQSTRSPQVKAVFLFLESLLKNELLLELPAGCLSNDLFAFSYSSDEIRIHEQEVVKTYWKTVCSNKDVASNNEVFCLVREYKALVAEKIPLLKKVPGGTTSGVSLVSYNSPAFESYGWKEKAGEQVANVSISSSGALFSMAALNRLLDASPPDPSDLNRTLSRQNIKLSFDTVVCYWTKNKNDISDSFGLAIEVHSEKIAVKSEQVQELYKSLWKGVPYKLEKPDEFYSLVLSGGQGRATVRDWIESNTQDVVDSLAQYFSDLRIVRCCPPPKDKNHPESFALSLLLEALADPKEKRKEGIPSAIGSQFYRASIDQRLLFPQTAFQRAIFRYRAELSKEHDKTKGWVVKNWNDARASIIKAYLNRKWEKESKYEEVTEAMNPNCTDKGYSLGQLMAVLEKLQQEALGGVNASIIDRCFSGASTSPKSVFGGLLRNARHHARKAKDKGGNKGAIFNLEKLIDQLCSQFCVCRSDTANPKTICENGFPSILTLDEQGLFILGYHQMRKWLWMNRDERDTWNADHSDAPRAYLWKRKINNETEEKGEEA